MSEQRGRERELAWYRDKWQTMQLLTGQDDPAAQFAEREREIKRLRALVVAYENEIGIPHSDGEENP